MSHFSETLMDHFQSPRHAGCMTNADAVGVAGTPGQGRYLILYLNVIDGRISRAQFEAHGCGVTIACGSVLTELVERRCPDECQQITAEMLMDALDGIPPHKQDCAGFAIRALQNALLGIESKNTAP